MAQRWAKGDQVAPSFYAKLEAKRKEKLRGVKPTLSTHNKRVAKRPLHAARAEQRPLELPPMNFFSQQYPGDRLDHSALPVRRGNRKLRDAASEQQDVQNAGQEPPESETVDTTVQQKNQRRRRRQRQQQRRRELPRRDFSSDEHISIEVNHDAYDELFGIDRDSNEPLPRGRKVPSVNRDALRPEQRGTQHGFSAIDIFEESGQIAEMAGAGALRRPHRAPVQGRADHGERQRNEANADPEDASVSRRRSPRSQGSVRQPRGGGHSRTNSDDAAVRSESAPVAQKEQQKQRVSPRRQSPRGSTIVQSKEASKRSPKNLEEPDEDTNKSSSTRTKRVIAGAKHK